MRYAPQLADHAGAITISDGTRIAYVDSAPGSQADPIVLVHGLQDEADSWRHVFQPLARLRRVLALDLPGFGRSDKRARRYSLEFFAGMVQRWLDALDIKRASFMGNSMGAMISEQIALTQPGRVRDLTLVAGTLVITRQPAGPSGALFRRLFANWLDKRYFARLRESPQAAYETLRSYYANLDALPQDDRDFLFQRVNERVWDEAQRLAALSAQLSFVPFFVRNMSAIKRGVPKLTMPTTVIWGSKDGVFPLENGPARARMQTGARYVEIAGAGHLPHQERPEAFMEALG
jgi:pimeloyl-ACP methyl ester carboxylesterase